MKELITVASFTAKDMLKRKSFIISNIIILLIIVAAFNVPNILNSINGGKESDEGSKILIIDNSNVFEGTLEAINNLEIGYNVQVENGDVSFEQIKEKIENEEIENAIRVTRENGKVNLEYIVENLLYIDKMPEELVSAISTIYTNLQISKLNLTPEEMQSITPQFEFKLTQTEEQEVKGNPVVMMILSLLLFYAVYFCAYQVSSSITTEKTSKIIETLVTSTKPSIIVLGKTIGIGIVGLIQILVIAIVALISANLFLEPGMLDGIINLENMTPFLFIVTIIYFLLGYFTYALLYALTGSTVSKPEDIQSANRANSYIDSCSILFSLFYNDEPN